MSNEKSYQTSVVSKFLYFQGISTTLGQGQTGRVFQLRVGSGSGIEKIFRVGSGRVGLGIGYLYQIPSQLGIMGY